MGTLLSYSLYSGIFMLAGYSVYRLLLSNEKQPLLNRMALLAIYMVSLFALPLSLALHKPHHIDMPVIEIGEGIAMIVDTPAEETSISIWNLLATIYLCRNRNHGIAMDCRDVETLPHGAQRNAGESRRLCAGAACR